MHHTGEVNPVSGIYRSIGCHSVERSIPKGHVFPPSSHCHRSVQWVLVRPAHTA